MWYHYWWQGSVLECGARSSGVRIPQWSVNIFSVKYQKEGVDHEWPAFDTVIIASGMESENTLYQQLKTAGKSVTLIGDADHPEDIYAATQQGYNAAVALG